MCPLSGLLIISVSLSSACMVNVYVQTLALSNYAISFMLIIWYYFVPSLTALSIKYLLVLRLGGLFRDNLIACAKKTKCMAIKSVSDKHLHYQSFFNDTGGVVTLYIGTYGTAWHNMDTLCQVSVHCTFPP